MMSLGEKYSVDSFNFFCRIRIFQLKRIRQRNEREREKMETEKLEKKSFL